MSNKLSELRARLEALASKWANNHNELSAHAECANELRALLAPVVPRVCKKCGVETTQALCHKCGASVLYSHAPDCEVEDHPWCRVVRFMNEPEPPEVKAELDAKEAQHEA